MHMRNQAECHFGVSIEFVEGFKFKSQAFENYCTACQSIRPAIPVHVEVPYVIQELVC